jgi:hypothetical protein
MVKKAVLIGINYVDHPEYQLDGCVDDVDNMKNMLIYKYEYLESNIILLTDDLPHHNILPTREMIMDKLITLVIESQELEELWIHYSGHGSQIDVSNNLESVVIPMDYDGSGPILADELFALISKIKCPAILLFDSCHSGNICEMPWKIDSDTGVAVKQHDVEIANPDIYVFGGCKESQECADKFDLETVEYVGAFTVSFLKCLYDNFSDVNIVEFYKTVLTYMREQGFVQIPVLTSSSMKMDRIITKTTPSNHINRIFMDTIKL